VTEDDDFDRFFKSPVITNYEPCEDWVLQWYKANAFQFVNVATAAQDLLAVPSAEVDVERLFSEGRDALGVRRMAMEADTMRMIRLLKSHWDLIDKKKKELTEKEIRRHNQVYGVSAVDGGNSFILRSYIVLTFML
jgi:hypothetical protein